MYHSKPSEESLKIKTKPPRRSGYHPQKATSQTKESGTQMKERIHVKNLTSSRSGEAVRNQYVITGDYYKAFQSYDSLIAVYEMDILTLGKHWDYSVTTMKYLYQFLQENCYNIFAKLPEGKSRADSIRKAIAQGIITYDNSMV